MAGIFIQGAWRMTTSKRHEQGLATRRAVLGEAPVARAQGHWDEVAMHIRATANTGASRADIQELILHVAIYAGVPTANHAIKIAKQTFAEMDGAL